MVGTSIRFLVFGAIFVALLVLVRKSKWVHKKWMTILSAILVLVLWSVSTMFPPENLFLTFPTARSAYYYMNMDHITDVLEGDESCLILSIKGSTTGMEFLPKNSHGYQLPGITPVRKLESFYINTKSGRGIIDLYHVNYTNDYYLFGNWKPKNNNDTFELSDNQNSEFLFYSTEIPDGTMRYSFYMSVNNLTEDYELYLNEDTTISFSKNGLEAK